MRTFSEHHMKLGIDAEQIITNGEGEAVPACLYLPPQESALTERVRGAGHSDNHYTSVYHDSRQSEFNTPVLECRDWQLDSCWVALRLLAQSLPKGYNILTMPSAPMSIETIEKAGRAASVSGCRPDYTLEKMPNPLIGQYRKLPYVLAGLHVHLDKPFETEPVWNTDVPLILLANIAGVISVLLSPLRSIQEIQSAVTRRKYYGGPYAHRPTKYGIEYRVFGSDVLADPAIVSCVLGACRLAMDLAPCDHSKFLEIPKDEAEMAIMSHDVDCARHIWKTWLLPLIAKIPRMDALSPFRNEEIEEWKGERYGDNYVAVNPLAALNYVCMGEWEFTPKWRQNWRIDDPFEGHGRTARGWILRMAEVLEDSNEFESFLRLKHPKLCAGKE